MSAIPTTIYHRYLKLLGYKPKVQGKNYHYFLGGDEVIREVYAGANGNGVRGYVYPRDAEKTGVFRFDETDPSFFRMPDALAAAAKKNRQNPGPRYADGAYNLGHMFFDARDGLDGLHFVVEAAQIISFQHTRPYNIGLSSAEEHCNYAKTEASKFLHRLHSDLDNTLDDEAIGHMLFQWIIQFIQTLNAQIWLWNRSNKQSISFVSIKDIAEGREFWGVESGVPALARTKSWFGQNNLPVWKEKFQRVLESLVEAHQRNVELVKSNTSGIDRPIVETSVVETSFTASIGQYAFPTPIAKVYSAYHNTSNPVYKYAYGIRTIEAVLQFVMTCLVSEMASIAGTDRKYAQHHKAIRAASVYVLKPSLGGLFKELPKLVAIRQRMDVPMMFPGVVGFVESDVYTKWLWYLTESRNQFAHDDLILSTQQAEHKVNSLELDRHIGIMMDRVSWLQSYHLGYFEECTPNRFNKTKLSAVWASARGIVEPGPTVELTMTITDGQLGTLNSDTVYIWSPYGQLLSLYPYLIRYEYTRPVLLWIRRCQKNESEYQFLYRHPVDDFYQAQNFLPTDNSNSYQEYRDNLFQTHSVTAVEILDGDLNIGIDADQLRIYSKIKRLGFGGSGEVYLARNFLKETKMVALKILKPEFMEENKMKKRFHYEGRLQHLFHPNVIQTYSTGMVNGLMYIEMEYIDGLTLKEKLAHPMGDAEKYDLMEQLLEGMLYLHDQQVYHRDLKPSNIMIGKDGVLKIIDFGIAKDVRNDDMTQTMTAQLMGTLAYRDMFSGRKDWHLKDIYGLGLLFADLHGCGPQTRFTKSLPERLSIWQDWYIKAINDDCTQRFQSVAEMKSAFERIRATLG